MALHRAQDRLLPTLNGNVLTSGGSLQLAKGQFGIFDAQNTTKNGLAALSDFSGLTGRHKLQLRLGTHENSITRTRGNKNEHSKFFNLQDITDIRVNAPSSEKTVDDLIVGYNGKDGSELKFETGDNKPLTITISGRALGFVGVKGDYSFTVYMSKENDGQTDQEIVEKAVEQINKHTFIADMVPVSTFIDVSVVDSTKTSLTGTDAHFYNLVLTDAGDSNAFAEVQAQYSQKVVKTDRTGLKSTYTVVATSLPTAFVQRVGSLVKGCDNCPTGFTANEGGHIYYLSIEDDGADLSTDIDAALEGMTEITKATVVKQGQDDGRGVYAVVTDAKVDSFDNLLEDDSTPLPINATMKVEYVGESKDICDPNTPTTTTAWTSGKTCKTQTEEYTITLKDDECGNSRLDELQAYYEDLVIQNVSGSNTACQRSYKTTVTTNIVCAECDPIFNEQFTSEAPEDFGFTSWEKTERTYSDVAKMGIRIKGKEALSIPDEFLRDDVPFYNTSVHISVSGGERYWVTESFKTGGKDKFPVKVLSRASDLANLGGHLWPLEDRDYDYFNRRTRFSQNTDALQEQFAKQLYGRESVINPNAQYIIYTIQVEPATRTQGFQKKISEGFSYMIAVEVGKHQRVETLLNKLAGAVGLPPVKAYGGN